jgi:hypothetical protein
MVLPILFAIIMHQVAMTGEQHIVEVEMADQEKPTRKPTLNIRTKNDTSTPTQKPSSPPRPQKLDRTSEQLKPLAKRVAENDAILQRFYQARGSEDENLGRQVIDEIRDYAQSLDPTISYVEGARLVLLLEEMFPRGATTSRPDRKQ